MPLLVSPDGKNAYGYPASMTAKDAEDYVSKQVGGPIGDGWTIEPDPPSKDSIRAITWKDTVSQTLHGTLPVLGMALGGMAGTPSGPAGNIVGAGLGYGIGEQTADLIDVNLLGLQKPPSLTEAMTKGATDVAVGAASQAVGGVAGRGVISPLAKVYANSPRIAKEGAEIAAKYGFNPTPAERSMNRNLQFGEKVGRIRIFSGGEFAKHDEVEMAKWLKIRTAGIDELGTPGGGENTNAMDRVLHAENRIRDVIDKYVNAQTAKSEVVTQAATAAEKETGRKISAQAQRQAEALKDSLLAKYGVKEKNSELGTFGLDRMASRNRLQYRVLGKYYDDLKANFADDEVLPLSNLDSAANRVYQEEMAKNPSQRNANILKIARENMSSVRDAVDEAGNPVTPLPPQTYDNVKSLKTNMHEAIRNWDTAQSLGNPQLKGHSSPEAGSYKRLLMGLQEDMLKAAEAKGPEVVASMRQANGFANKFYKFYQDKDVIRFMTEDPEHLLAAVSKPGDVSVPMKFKNAIGNDGLQRFRKQLTYKLFGMDKGPEFDPSTLTKNINRWGETLNVFYSKAEVNQMREVARVATNIIGGAELKGAPVKAVNLAQNDFFVKLVKSNPKSFYSFITNAANERYLPEFEKVLGPGLMGDIKATWLANALETNQFGKINPNMINSEMVKKHGHQWMQRFLGKDLAAKWEELGKVATIQNSVEKYAGNPSGTASVLANVEVFVGLGRIGSAIANPMQTVGSVIGTVWLPKRLAKLYLSPFGVSALTRNYNVPVASKQGETILKMLTKISTAGALESEERRKQGTLAPLLYGNKLMEATP